MSTDSLTVLHEKTWPGGVVVVAYSAAVAGVNLPNPLTPISSAVHGFGPATQAALFSLYLAALVVGLIVVPRVVRITGRVALNLTVLGAAVLILADALLAASSLSVTALFAARAVGGIGLALATGGAASLALSVAGERGRAAVGVGAVAGSLVGNAGGALMADLLPAPTVVVPLVHTVATIALALATFALPRPQDDGAVSLDDGQLYNYATRHRTAGYILGGLSWTVAGAVIALAPAAVRDATGSDSLLLASGPGGLLLATGFAGQLLVRSHIASVRAWMVSIPMTLGTVALGYSLLEGSVAGMLFAGALIGIGHGPAYTLGLVTVTHRLPPEMQGRAASRYAAIAYVACGVFVLLAGVAANAYGGAYAFLLIGVIAVAGSALSASFAGAPQQQTHSGQMHAHR